MQELHRCYKAGAHKFPVPGGMVDEILYGGA
jgi:energy-converting hydrogenase Eha subunit F